MTGILLIDKPQGWTSSDVVAKLRGILHERRIGHSGTLDPLATGLLVVFVGRATRAVAFAEGHDKRYMAGLRLGVETDTQDVTGTRTGGEPRPVTEAELEAALAQFQGPIQQIPPMYSAIKVGGKKLYEIARRGGEVERKPRPVTIRELRLAGREGEDWLLDVVCSKGTYVRTLCHDLGRSLGCGGCMSSLRRVQAGDFSVAQAYTLDQVQAAADRGEAESLLLPVDSLFAGYPALTVSAAREKKLRTGAILPTDEARSGPYRVYGTDGAFLALCEAKAGQLKTIKSFFEVDRE
ncbi:MAG: tRNA pseudouridine(55) synthase TruB [Oscillospiraceae bacterium]|nr:tRNA pseudouridine(55) synthase TruB [Oscillospiraceae bacterium]